MSADLAQQAVADLRAAKEQLAAKKRLLQEVFCDLRTMETDRGVGGMMDLEQIATTSERYCKYKVALSVAFEESACALVVIQNTSETCNLLVSAHILTNQSSEVTSCLTDASESVVDYLPPSSQGTLVVAYPQFHFISTKSVRIVLNCRWISSRPTESVPGQLIAQLENNGHPAETYVISAPLPQEWKKMDELSSCTEKDATLMQLLASVSLKSRNFSPVEPYGFREMFSKFDSCDFGEWQLLVGSEEFAGLMVGPSSRETGLIDRVYGKSSSQLDAFLQKIQPLL